MSLQNWARNHQYRAARVHHPTTVEEVRELVARAGKVKALGARHSFNTIADTSEDLIALDNLNRVVALDRERSCVTVEGGINYGELCPQLHRERYALHNTASLPHVTVAGACATATHGSGDGNGNLATVVAEMEVVTADGSVAVFSREKHPDLFPGAVVSLGGLGVVTRLVLDVVPEFTVRQSVYEELPLAELEAHFDELTAAAYSVSLFTDWRSSTTNQVWIKHRVSDDAPGDPEPEFFGARLATVPVHAIVGLSPDPCTEQLGIPGPWHERLPHFRIGHQPSSGDELQSEYFVPRRHAVAALRAVGELREEIAPLLQISEIRTIAADTLWMSPCYRQASVAVHFTWNPDWDGVRALLPRIEDALAPFDARPHWGKLFTLSPERLRSLYEKLPDFLHLLRTYDPQGKFRNDFLDTYLFGNALA